MKNLRSFLFPVLMTLGLCANVAYGEDIDLYTGDTSGGDSNILFVLDNESNWGATMGGTLPSDLNTVAACSDSSYYCAQKYALISLLQKVDPVSGNHFIADGVGIGIMMYGSGANKGSYIRFGIRKMNATNRAALITLLKALDVLGDKGSSQQDYGLTMWEGFKYFGGGTGSPWSSTSWGPIPDNGVGVGTNTRDYPSNATMGSAFWAGATTPYAYTSSSTNNSGASPPVQYTAPTHTSACGKNYIIYVGHSDSQANDSLGGTFSDNAQAMFIGVGGSSTRVPSGSPSSGDEAARYLFNSDVDPNTAGTQNVVTYTIGTYQAPCTGQVCSMITTMKSMANQGGGAYYDATNIQKLTDAIEDILTNIQGTPSVFASATLPVSVNTQGLYLNQVFIGMFKPDEGGSPKWLGNLKQYKLQYDAATNSLRLVDSTTPTANFAVDASSGFITTTAKSYWTSSSSFWTNWVPSKTSSASDSPDGPEVQKGGAAQRQREVNLTSQASRNVYTCPVTSAGAPNCATTSLSATPFNTTTLVPSNAGTQTAFNYPAAWVATTTASTDITNLIDWTRGTDNLNNELGPGGTTTVRPTIHGDVLHSHPVALDFAGRVVVFYGSNEGMVRAVEAKQTGSGAGNELWAFVAPQLFGKLNRLRQQSPNVILPSDPIVTTFNKSYFMDGAIGAYQTLTSAIIYVPARRGGNFIYALDVTNPDDPKVKFTLSPSTASMSLLGQTWSLPKVARMRDGTSTGRIVLIFGGGYDVAEDINTHGTTGRGVYVVDAVTGVVLKQFLTAVNGTDVISTSIPSDVTIIDTDRDGFVDRAYVGDLDGNVWRMDLDDGTSTNPSTGWKLYKLANLGSRKFFFPPDVVITSGFDAVLIGSGDREKPLAITSSDRFYMIKDAKTGLDGSGQTTIIQGDLVLNTADSSAAKGWYYNLNVAGEKVVNAPLTVGGVVYFGTNRPTPAAVCTSNLGEARSYAVNFLTGAGTRLPGGAGTGDDAYSEVLAPLTGLPPSPVAGLVDIDGNGTIVPFCLGCGDRRSSLEAGVPAIDPAPYRRKTYWKFKNDN
jgi:type IV pilus assembly protein PilY1